MIVHETATHQMTVEFNFYRSHKRPSSETHLNLNCVPFLVRRLHTEVCRLLAVCCIKFWTRPTRRLHAVFRGVVNFI